MQKGNLNAIIKDAILVSILSSSTIAICFVLVYIAIVADFIGVLLWSIVICNVLSLLSYLVVYLFEKGATWITQMEYHNDMVFYDKLLKRASAEELKMHSEFKLTAIKVTGVVLLSIFSPLLIWHALSQLLFSGLYDRLRTKKNSKSD